MNEYVNTDGLADDICDKLGPLKPSASMQDACKGLLDTILERADEVILGELEKAVEKAVADRLANPPSLADLVVFNDQSGQELAAALNAAPYLDRVAFFRALAGGLSSDALSDLSAELLRG